MLRKYSQVLIRSFVIAVVGVFGVDYFSHLLFSAPMETTSYFFAKLTLFFLFSLVFLSFFGSEETKFLKVLVGGIIVSLIWGTYYNILPNIFDFYPFGIPLVGLTFLGMGLFGTGLAFGIVHAVAFVVGYYISKLTVHIL